MATPIIRWKFLDLSVDNTNSKASKQVEGKIHNNKPPKSFVEAVNNVSEIPTSRLLKPCVKGDRLSIVIPKEDPKEEYQLGVKACKHILHGRVI